MADLMQGKYEEVDISVFEPGMHLNTSVYYTHRGNLVLLCPDTVVDGALLTRLLNHEALNEKLLVPAAAREDLVRRSRQLKAARERAEFRARHDSLSRRSSALLKGAVANGTLSKADADVMTRDIVNVVETVSLPVILQCVNRIRAVDEYLYVHSTNVSLLCGLMGKWLGLGDSDLSALTEVGLLHDTGKVRIPAQILNKPGRLTEGEFRVIKLHSVCSQDIVSAAGEQNPLVLRGVRGHHEKVNGSGYPDGLIGSGIPYFSRVCAICDIYDAMVAERVYKAAASPFDVLAEFAKQRFAYLDAQLVDLFLDRIPDELMGKAVLLSNGETGTVVYVDRGTFSNPVVEVGGKVFAADAGVRCVAMIQDDERDPAGT